jgi:hypothetical protein
MNAWLLINTHGYGKGCGQACRVVAAAAGTEKNRAIWQAV